MSLDDPEKNVQIPSRGGFIRRTEVIKSKSAGGNRSESVKYDPKTKQFQYVGNHERLWNHRRSGAASPNELRRAEALVGRLCSDYFEKFRKKGDVVENRQIKSALRPIR